MYLERQAEKARAKQAAVQAVYDNLKLQGVNVTGDGQVVDVSDDSYGDSKDSEDRESKLPESSESSESSES